MRREMTNETTNFNYQNYPNYHNYPNYPQQQNNYYHQVPYQQFKNEHELSDIHVNNPAPS